MTMTPTAIFLFSTVVAVIAGLAALFRSPKEMITWRDLASHSLNMGTCGASMSMLLYVFLTPEHGTDFLIIGIVGILSLMGLPLITFATELAKRFVSHTVTGKINHDGKE